MFKKKNTGAAATTLVKLPTLQEKASAVVDGLKTDVLLLSRESNAAVEAFSKVVTKIDAVNAELKEKRELAEAQIKELQTIVSSCQAAELANEKIKAKALEFIPQGA